jgi:arylsulfatase A
MRRLLVLLLLLASPAVAYERLQGPTELLYWNKEKAFDGYTLFGLPATALSIASPASAPADSVAPPARPNFVVVLGEGHGWTSTSVQMDDAVPESRSDYVRTPNLEKLAQAGMRFANFYAPSPRCTPSRAAYFTGIGPAKLHMTFVGEGRRDAGGADAGRKLVPPRCSLELSPGAVTIASVLKREGFATAHFGKWHVGRVSPENHGFDESDGATGNGGPDNVDNPHPKELYGMTDRGIDFMSRQARAGKPFYLQLSHYASRQGGDASPEATAAVKTWGGNLNDRELAQAAADWDLDLALGKLLKKIDDLGIADRTYVIFTTDHGSPGRNSPLAGGKGTIYDGGLRVPLIVRGPGVKAGSCCRVRTVGVDLFPTIAEIASIRTPLPGEIEGGSLVSLLHHQGQGGVKRPNDDYVVHFPHYDKDELGPTSAFFSGNFKLIRVYETGALKLFDLAKDPAERRDLSAEMPDRVQLLNQALSKYLAAVKAQLPTVNANYDPSKAPSEPSQGKKDQRGARNGGGGKGQGGKRKGQNNDRAGDSNS